MQIEDAVEPHPQGCIIRFEVVAGCSILSVPSGFNCWRRSLEARLTEEPSRGRANRQLVEEAARILSVPKSDVQVLSGQKNARKVLLVKGIAADATITILKRCLK
jgi:uncharacterized protein (TIGR00251 family)